MLQAGNYTLALGYEATADSNGSFVYGDGSANTVSDTSNEFMARASHGYKLFDDATTNPALTLRGGNLAVTGTVSATGLSAQDTLVVGSPSQSGTFILYDNPLHNAAVLTVASLASNRNYTIPDAGANAGFVMDQGSQTIAGAKLFSSAVNTSSQYEIGGTTVLAYNSGSSVLSVGPSTTTAGTNSTYFGASVGNSSSGDANVGVGNGISVGPHAGAGDDNTFVGSTAGYNSSGSNNTALGFLAGSQNSGHDNTYLGYYSGHQFSGSSFTAGNYNIYLGENTGTANTTGSNNTFVGNSADATGNYTNATALGNGAVVTASNTIQLGNGSVTLVNTSGAINGASYQIGGSTVLTNAGTQNIFVGAGAGTNNTSGTENTATGSDALNANSSGSDNTATGWNALANNNTGVNNTAIGQQTLTANTSGGSNTALGAGAMQQNITGTHNSATGQGALYANTAGNDNTSNGMNSLYNTTGANNTAVGFSAGETNSTGTNNTFLGYAADASSGALTNATAIGNGATVTASNTIQLGNSSVTTVNTSGALSIGGALNLNSHQINNVTDPTNAQDAATKNYVDAAAGNYIANSNSVQSGANFAIGGSGFAQGTLMGIQGVSTNYGFEIGGLGPAYLVLTAFGTGNIFVGSGADASLNGGQQNTALGVDALTNNGTGSSNTSVGYNTMHTNSTGSNNTVVGFNADVSTDGLTNATAIGNGATVAASNTIQLGNSSVTLVNTSGAVNGASYQIGGSTVLTNAGTNNIFVGASAGAVNTATDNAAVGASAMAVNTTGTWNTAVGSNALAANTTASGNTAMGYHALAQSTTGTGSNAAFGENALAFNTTGGANTAVGAAALYQNRTGTDNTAVGLNALSATTGSGNTGIGWQALISNTTGSNNTAIGIEADVASGSLTNATVIGYNATVAASNTIQLGNSSITLVNTSGAINGASYQIGGTTVLAYGNQNFFAGPQVGSSATGVWNTGLGIQALQSLTSAHGNTAAGLGALNADTSGNSNAAFGYQALFVNLSGNKNDGFGEQALFHTTTGSNNSAVGEQSLYANTTGGNNTAIGYQALQSNTTGGNNTAVGYQADVASNNLTNATAIGNGAVVSASNTIQLGNAGVTNVNTSGGITAGGAGSFGGALNMNSHAINNVTDPTNAQDAATKNYVDTHASGWGLTGNSGTNPAVDFIGTSDSTDLHFRVNGQPAGVVEVNRVAPNVGLGIGVLANNDTAYNSANSNVGMGWYALNENTEGSDNTGLGWGALQQNTTGGDNTATGNATMTNNSTGAQNTALGSLALETNTTGNDNTAIGYGADMASDTLTNATSIGANAIVGESNALVLGGTGANAVKVGIGTTTPVANLEIAHQSGNTSLQVDGEDVVGADYPSEIISNSSGLTFGPNTGQTLGRMLRLQDLNQGTFYDQGIDGTDSYFLEVGNSNQESFVMNPNGYIGVNTTTTYAPFDVLQTGGQDVLLGGGNNTGSEIKLLSSGYGHFSIYNYQGILTFANTGGESQTNTPGNSLMTIDGSGDVTVSGTTTSGYFVGDGSQLTNVSASLTLPYSAEQYNTTDLFQIRNVDDGDNTANAIEGDAVNGNGVVATSYNGAGLSASSVGGDAIQATANFGNSLTANGNIALLSGNMFLASAGQIQFSDSTANYLTTFNSATQSANISYVLPASQGGANTVLTNDGSGNLSWGAGGGGLNLPYAQTSSNDGPLFQIGNTDGNDLVTYSIEGDVINGYGVIGKASGQYGNGVYGLSGSGGGDSSGVVAEGVASAVGLTARSVDGDAIDATVFDPGGSGNGLVATTNGSGDAIDATATGSGIGLNANSDGSGYAINASANGSNSAIFAQSENATAIFASATTNDGVDGVTNDVNGYGVHGFNNNGGVGVQGNNTANAAGVEGENSSTGPGVLAQNDGSGPGLNAVSNGTGDAIDATTSSNGSAVFGNNSGNGTALTAQSSGGEAIAANASGNQPVIVAQANGNGDALQLFAFGSGNVMTGYGNVAVTGTISAGSSNNIIIDGNANDRTITSDQWIDIVTDNGDVELNPASNVVHAGGPSNTANIYAHSFYGDGSNLTNVTAGNTSELEAQTWEAPGTIGSTTPNTGAFTTLTSIGNANINSAGGSNTNIGNETGTLAITGPVTNTYTTNGNQGPYIAINETATNNYDQTIDNSAITGMKITATEGEGGDDEALGAWFVAVGTTTGGPATAARFNASGSNQTNTAIDVTAGNVAVAGNIATSNGGTITSDGLLTASGGLTTSDNVSVGGNTNGDLVNTSDNNNGSDGHGISPNSIDWATTGRTGYAASITNENSGQTGDGLLVKVYDNSSSTVALNVSQGSSTSAGTSLLTVRGDGSIAGNDWSVTNSGEIISGAGSTAGVIGITDGAGHTAAIVSGAGTATLTLPASTGTLALSGAGATEQQTTASGPSGTTSTTAVQMGLAGSITPSASGKVMLIISGDLLTTNASDGAAVQISYGTGTAPSNGAAATGTTVGSDVEYNASGTEAPFTTNAVITGLTPGTTYWIDLQVRAITGGTASVTRISTSAIELP